MREATEMEKLTGMIAPDNPLLPPPACTCGDVDRPCGAHRRPEPVRTPLRSPQRVSREDFDRAMRLLKADRSAEGLHLITLHVEAGKIEATYAEIHRVGYIGEVGDDE